MLYHTLKSKLFPSKSNNGQSSTIDIKILKSLHLDSFSVILIYQEGLQLFHLENILKQALLKQNYRPVLQFNFLEPLLAHILSKEIPKCLYLTIPSRSRQKNIFLMFTWCII